MLAPFVTRIAQARHANPRFTQSMAGLPRFAGTGALVQAAANSPYKPRLSSWVFVTMMEWQYAQEDSVFVGKMMFERGRDMQPDRRDQEL
jgi:hypothetical protein